MCIKELSGGGIDHNLYDEYRAIGNVMVFKQRRSGNVIELHIAGISS